MPIGASKVGALGGLVPGGSVTFNAPGTFDVPPGVKIVSITGVGATGNPGTSGTSGNPGNPGSGAIGGTGYKSPPSPPSFQAGRGGSVLAGTDGDLSSTVIPSLSPPVPNVGNNGNAGSAGSAGSAGNPGQSSSGLGNTFPGGAGGNAGAAGNAGNAGNGGQAGAAGGASTGGAGGNGGGSGGGPSNVNFPSLPFLGPQNFTIGGAGGGGAGATNDGTSATCSPIRTNPMCPATTAWWMGPRGGQGGTTSNYSSPIWPVLASPNGCGATKVFPGSFPTNVTGGSGGSIAVFRNNSQYSANIAAGPSVAGGVPQAQSNLVLRLSPQQPGSITPYPLANPASQAIRSGGGGGAAAPGPDRTYGGGGGGGRGNAGNAGGTGGAGGNGAAGTPQTFNCVPVTPGSPTPITVASPGGQIVISWNPQ